jgi:hypothetical protein
MNLERAEVAGMHAEERELGRPIFGGGRFLPVVREGKLKRFARAFSAEQGENRRIEILFPGIRADRRPKEPLIVTLAHSVRGGMLVIAESRRKIVGGMDFVEDNRRTAPRRADDAVVPFFEGSEKLLQMRTFKDHHGASFTWWNGQHRIYTNRSNQI